MTIRRLLFRSGFEVFLLSGDVRYSECPNSPPFTSICLLEDGMLRDLSLPPSWELPNVCTDADRECYIGGFGS